jgi:hypothetical protein
VRYGCRCRHGTVEQVTTGVSVKGIASAEPSTHERVVTANGVVEQTAASIAKKEVSRERRSLEAVIASLAEVKNILIGVAVKCVRDEW